MHIEADLTFDRASLTAIHPLRRTEYSRLISKVTKTGGYYFIEGFELFDPTPVSTPFHIGADEPQKLFPNFELVSQRSDPPMDGMPWKFVIRSVFQKKFD